MSVGFSQADFERALKFGRPPNIKKLFPNSKALLVSGKYIDRVMRLKTSAAAMAGNGRSYFIIRGVLMAAHEIGAAVIIEIARSEGGVGAYCGVNFWNISNIVNSICNELGIMVPVAIHADHYGIKKWEEVAVAKIEIPSLFDFGVTSIAVDASHMPDDQNLLANIELYPFIPEWAGFETEIGEIKGEEGLSTVEEAEFLIYGLNAYNIFPDWIALNNGTTHGFEDDPNKIKVMITIAIHQALQKFKMSGAQHGTSGNSFDRLRELIRKTFTTKANVATALQIISWGLQVNDYGNCFFGDDGFPVKLAGHGVIGSIWDEMQEYSDKNDIPLKKLNGVFENRLLGQPKSVRERMSEEVAQFALTMMRDVFNAAGTAEMVIEDILKLRSYNPGAKVGRIVNADEWTKEQIREKVKLISQDKGPEGNFDE